jgi:RNA polymerase sigma-70 factor (ECF subfamily)
MESLLDRSDEALASAARDGERPAFEALVRRYASHLLAVVLRQVADDHRAADLVQEIWIKVYRALPRWQPAGSFRSWLFSIALNHVRDARRADRRAAVVQRDDFRQHAAAPGPDAASRSEEKERVARALAKVSEPFRTAVMLVDLLQLSYEEAATSLDCRVGTVKSRVNRGRLQFRDEFLRLEGPRDLADSCLGGPLP